MTGIRNQELFKQARGARRIVDARDKELFGVGWMHSEQAVEPNPPCGVGDVAACFQYYQGRNAAAEAGVANCAVESPAAAETDSTREQRRFELAKAALTGFCAASGAVVSADAHLCAVSCWELADVMLATEGDKKDRSAAA